tara:strand:- start:3656 stop:4687 length:1032 start_codon:yes stop_codon:yes gene_type:complete
MNNINTKLKKIKELYSIDIVDTNILDNIHLTDYNLNYSSKSKGYYVLDIIKWLFDTNKNKMNVLEIGTYLGSDTLALLSIFKNITTIEINKIYLENAINNIYLLNYNKYKKIKFVLGNALWLLSNKKKFKQMKIKHIENTQTTENSILYKNMKFNKKYNVCLLDPIFIDEKKKLYLKYDNILLEDYINQLCNIYKFELIMIKLPRIPYWALENNNKFIGKKNDKKKYWRQTYHKFYFDIDSNNIKNIPFIKNTFCNNNTRFNKLVNNVYNNNYKNLFLYQNVFFTYLICIKNRNKVNIKYDTQSIFNNQKIFLYENFDNNNWSKVNLKLGNDVNLYRIYDNRL